MTFIFTSNDPAHLVWRGEDLAPLERRLVNDRAIPFDKNKNVTRHGVAVGNTPAAAAPATATPESPELLEILDANPPVYLEDYINEHM